MQKMKGSKRWGLHATVFGIAVTFLIAGAIAFPSTWNTVATKSGFLPEVTENEFNLGLDLQGGAHLIYEANMDQIPESDRVTALDGVRDVIERRVNAFGIAEPVVQTNINGGHYRIIIELAGVFDVSEAISLIGETPILEFKLPTTEINLELTDEQQTEIDVAQESERKIALELLDSSEDISDDKFTELAKEYSIDEATKENGGYIGWVEEDDAIFDGLITEIQDNRYKHGIIDGLYESTSSLHIVKYLDDRTEVEPEVSHILICHNESERCESDRTREEAEEYAMEILDEVTTRNFAEKAMEVSDGPSSVDGGDLGFIKKGQMVTAFEEVAFDLRDGRIAKDLVETEFGFHIIYREDSKKVKQYELAHIELPWTTASDVLVISPWENTGLSGKQVKGASVAFDQNTGSPYVVLNFDSEGGDLFAEMTENHVGDVIGIFLDGEPISTPVVQSAIYGGEASISGDFTVAEAKLLVQRLNAGALPVPVDLLSQQTVGPTLGARSLDRSIDAALIGFALVALFMVLYYRLAGLIAVISLVVYAFVNLALYKVLGVTITLAGIAGFILSLGMAVDANVLIFERLKEELAAGRDLPTAIDEGFRRAWSSIRDGNFTTLIAAGVLFTMSTSFIKGFALTLGLGILISMLTAILVTRILLKWIIRSKSLRNKWLYNGSKQK